MPDQSRKATITPENEREARLLRNVYQWAKDKDPSLTQAKVGEAIGMNQSAVSQMMQARIAISLGAAIGFAKVFACTVDDFSPRLAKLIREGTENSRTPRWDPLNGTDTWEVELLRIFRQIPEQEKHYLLQDANKYLARQSSAPSASNPFPAQRVPELPGLTKTGRHKTLKKA